MDTVTVGKRIAAMRKEGGFTQESLAEMLSVSPQAVSKWENGHALPETSLLPSVAKALDTSIDSLLTSSIVQVLSAYYGDGMERHNVTNNIRRILSGAAIHKPNRTPTVKVGKEVYAKYFKPNQPAKEIQEIVEKALEMYFGRN